MHYIVKYMSHNCQFIGGVIAPFYAPVMTMARALSVTPVHPSVLYLRTSVNTFDQNFMKLGHIVQYHNVFFKFDIGPYRTRLSVVMALCL